MDKDRVLPLVDAWRDAEGVGKYQRDSDFAVLQKVADAVRDIDRFRYCGGPVVCTGCSNRAFKEGADIIHDSCCPWVRLEKLGIVEKACG